MSDKHRHAELMMQYAQDALETDKPWARWEFKPALVGDWQSLKGNPNWKEFASYRRKPRTIRIGEYDVPEPVRNPLERDQKYYIANVDDNVVLSVDWDNDGTDEKWLKAGIIYLNKEDAELCSKALGSLLRKK